MTAKKNPPDIRKIFADHLEASLKEAEWARKGLELVEAGKIDEAKAALKEAERWEFRRRKLEL